MDKVKMQSMDIVGNNIEKIGALFPNCITEVKNERGQIEKAIDFDKLRQELSRNLVEGKKERYEFTWPDKRQAIVTANAPISKTLRPVREKSVDFDTTQNVYIEGDNLDALKLLQETYLGKIKMIYIDPPYNTGNDFVYEDDFSTSADDYLKMTGDSDEQGNKLTANKDSNGRFHTDWLNMIYPRLKLAKDLLSEDGVIFISIDDNEQDNLKKSCAEVFGAQNFIAQLIWERAYSPKNDARFISTSHDYVLMVAKNIDRFVIGRLPRTAEANARYQNPDNDPRGVWKPSDLSVKTYNSACDYPITAPSGRIIEPPAGRCWSLSQNAFWERLNDNRIYFGADGNSVPCMKRFLSELKFDGMAPTSIMFYKDVGHSQEGAKEVTALMDAGVFDGPKPIRLLNRLLTLANLEDDSLILDFFSGSATTANALLQYNVEKETHCNFVLVQLSECTDETGPAFKAGYKSICDIGEERIRRAGKKIKEEAGLMGKDLDVGFRVFKIDDSNMKDIYYRPDEFEQDLLSAVEDNIKEDRTSEDLLFQVMIDDFGIPLSAKIEKISVDGKTIFNVEDGHLVACFDKGVTDEVITAMAKLEPNYAALRDSSYASDSVAVNFEQIFKKYSPDTKTKIL